jgi:DNA mismatch repair protein MutH
VLARNEADLLARARALEGEPIDRLAARLGVASPGAGARTKGKLGALLERALGATGGARRTWDFPELRIELKTVPLDSRGAPRESTFVCTVSLDDADRAEWATSWARAKLGRVLWIPVCGAPGGARTIGHPLLWSPTPAQDQGLGLDFEEIMGQVGIGDVEGTTARAGQWLQLRPKAAHGRVRTVTHGREGTLVETVPRGFYLRARFTAAILRDPAAVPVLAPAGASLGGP